jgi:hypothetical protein
MEIPDNTWIAPRDSALAGGGGRRSSGGEVDHAMLHKIPCMIGPRPSSNAQGGVG